jgi:hypothetical protein
MPEYLYESALGHAERRSPMSAAAHPHTRSGFHLTLANVGSTSSSKRVSPAGFEVDARILDQLLSIHAI